MEWLGEVFVKLKFILRELLISSKYRKRLKNNSFTLITNDCTAGAIYKDLHVRFNTPTINLYMNADDFLKFVNNLSQYMGEEITPYESGGGTEYPYPVGILRDIVIHFMHYETFETAREKWNERKKRINFNNIFIMMNDRNGFANNHFNQFESLPYDNKIIFTHRQVDWPSSFYIKGFEKEESVGIVLHYRSRISIKKYYDQFDFVNWLNEGYSEHN